MRVVWKLLKWSLAAILLVVLLLLSPVAYIEAFCHGERKEDPYTPLITDAAFQRREANTFLTYPEWHIVYAYDGLAETLKTGDEYAFDYLSSIRGFWTSTCALTKVADAHGGADSATRMTIHTIGVSFTLEMALKAAYEETIGRLTALLRGENKTPQDQVAAGMAVEYAAFLRQTPWYMYPFGDQVEKLQDAPVTDPVRGWERRFALGTEWRAKVLYAGMIANAVAGTTGAAQLEIRSIVSGLPAAELAAIAGVTVIGENGGDIEIQTPRYDLFTRILVEIAEKGGAIREIAGNDDIMVSVTEKPDQRSPERPGTEIARINREGFDGSRVLIALKVTELAALLRVAPLADPGLEHVFDY
ncbi:hypothetical protein ADU59_18430 [Pararhizobium polonicum]|uniref:Uncharacterized protein n=1 Tax=Pararhizobium polonicum TaxID=1612624 RepID=A0A1C7NYW1_9HYPH|nr:hypothetical protein [Pararhizobium polonicum]OBZ94158.1 hypothetical protein ADU59_18430 [Pararhizobium polonicum]